MKNILLLTVGVCVGIAVVHLGIHDVIRLQNIPALSWTNWTNTRPSSTPTDTDSQCVTSHELHTKLQHITSLLNDLRIDCPGVIANHSSAMNHAISIAEQDARLENETGSHDIDNYFIQEARSCSKFISQYGFITDVLSEEEKDFPLAYSIVAFKDTEMIIRQLRAIYRPQNFYCIHLDAKLGTGPMFQAVSAVARCLPNVFLSSRRVDVVWATMTVLEADLICMQDLWKYKWRYFINLTGQEFPLKTNYELVKILQAYRGANDCPGTTTQ